MVRKGQILEAVVDSVYTFGVFVHLEETNERAYIRRRELTLSGNKNPQDVITPKMRLKTVVLELSGENRMIELSVRKALPDPWVQFARETGPRDIIFGTVKYLYANSVLVEVQPGIDGLISLENLSTQKINRPEEVVWQNDHVQAVVLDLNPTTHQLQLSIRHLLLRLNYANELLDELNRVKAQDMEEQDLLEVGAPPLLPETQFRYNGKILVVEDIPDVRDPLVQWLRDEGCNVEGSGNGLEGLEKIRANRYDLILADINMPMMTGIELIRTIREEGINTPVAIMTTPDLVENCGLDLEVLKISTIFVKPLDRDDLRNFLIELQQGRASHFRVERTGPVDAQVEMKPFNEILDLVRSSKPLLTRLNVILESLLNLTHAESAILFELDPVSRIIQIKASTGTLAVNQSQLPNLMFSPVEDVISENETVWENSITHQKTSAFRNLRKVLHFESCIGVPVTAAGRCEHALFIFHHDEDFFSRYRVRDVRSSALLISVAMENDVLNREAQNLAQLMLAGQLTSAFNHEVYNKFSGLDLEMNHLKRGLRTIENQPEAYARKQSMLETWESMNRIDTIMRDMYQMVKDFREITKGIAAASIDVNQVISQVYEKILPLAQNAGVELWLIPENNLPRVSGNQFGLYYVFFNLVLNSIQHLKDRTGERLVKIDASSILRDSQKFLQIRFIDNGPGIHRQLWEKIFEMGFTTREGGSGLGLFIARSLLQAMGAKIMVEESQILLGTTFLVELPTEDR